MCSFTDWHCGKDTHATYTSSPLLAWRTSEMWSNSSRLSSHMVFILQEQSLRLGIFKLAMCLLKLVSRFYWTQDMWSVKCVNWFPVCLSAPCPVWRMLVLFLLGKWEVQAARLHRDAEIALHFSIFVHHNAGYPAPWEPVLVVIQWCVMQQLFSLI